VEERSAQWSDHKKRAAFCRPRRPLDALGVVARARVLTTRTRAHSLRKK
jgi:hypothetical protein